MDEDEGSIPDALRLVDVAKVDLDNPQSIVARWAAGGRTTSAVVGASADGVFSLDLKHDGPHGLVAGTTGSGKSEFLQTLVASLAVENRPEAINFVLVDYKGASAFADCERLPHTVGMVSNLDGHLTERALTALNAELKRREHALRAIGAPDIDSAWEKDSERAIDAGLPRLLIVIDEFAELVHELPDFVTGLIRVARVGRSLGVHLVLATQRPTGVVSAEMKANTGLRIGLRMEDRADSSEVLENPDAAYISRATPGRAFARLGGGSRVTQFQAARVAGRRRGLVEGLAAPQLIRMRGADLGRPLQLARQSEAPVGSMTDLYALVELLNQAAAISGSGVQRSPWLEPLTNTFVLPLTGETDETCVVIGLEDKPASQEQAPAFYDLVNDGHLIIAGSARSGRSTALRTLGAALANRWSPDELHLFGMDFGNGALLPLTALRHTGAVTGRTETGRIERLAARLLTEVARRQSLFSTKGYGDIAEQRRNAGSKGDTPLPYMMLLLDRWEGFLGEFPMDSDADMSNNILRLLREGPTVGLRIVISGDRSLLSDRITSQIESKYVLKLSSKDDYALAGISSKKVAIDLAPGRAYRSDSGNELQFGLLTADASATAQNLVVSEIAAHIDTKWPPYTLKTKPLRVDMLPSVIHIDQLGELPSTFDPSSPLSAVVGVGGDTLACYGVNLADEGPFFLVAGASHSGRSTTLCTMASMISSFGSTVLAVCPRRSPLQWLSNVDGASVFGTGLEDAAKMRIALQEAVGTVAIFIDDAEMFAGTPMDEAIREEMEGREGVAIVIAGGIDQLKNEIRGLLVDARKSRVGILLSPQSMLDGDLLGLRLPRNLLGKTQAGRGIFIRQGDLTVVQVPMPTASETDDPR